MVDPELVAIGGEAPARLTDLGGTAKHARGGAVRAALAICMDGERRSGRTDGTSDTV